MSSSRLSGYAIASLGHACLASAWCLVPTRLAYGCGLFAIGLLLSLPVLHPRVAQRLDFGLFSAPPEQETGPDLVPSRGDHLGLFLVLACLVLATLTLPYGPAFILALLSIAQVRQRRAAPRSYSLPLTALLLSVLGGFFWLGFVLPDKLQLTHTYVYAECLGKAKVLAGAMLMYADDYDGTFPPAHNWCDQLQPYLGRASRDILPHIRRPGPGAKTFVCPSARHLRCGYAYNSALAGLSPEALPDPGYAVLIFESDAGWNAHGGPELLSEEPRHSGGDNYAFADGHARSRSRSEARELQWQPRLRETGGAE